MNVSINRIQMSKPNIAVIFGGDSEEYRVSLLTAYYSSKELMKSNKYNLHFFGIQKNSTWKYDNNLDNIIINPDIYAVEINQCVSDVFQIGNGMINNIKIDCAFLATHGKNGEDGNLQGFLMLNNIKHTGANIYGSSACFNKYTTKLFAYSNNVPIVPYVLLNSSYINDDTENLHEFLQNNGNEYVVKITKGGSSVGVFFCERNNIDQAIKKAFEMDDEILVEKQIKNIRELFVGIIGKDELFVSDVFETLTNNSFYSYDNKYSPTNSSDETLATNIDDMIIEKIKKSAILLYKKMNIKSYCRIDYFVEDNKTLYLNEINNLPGLRPTSSFTNAFSRKCSFGDMLDKIIEVSLN